MKKRYFLILPVLIFLLAIFFYSSEERPPHNQGSSIAALLKTWGNRIDTDGPVVSYENLKQTYKSYNGTEPFLPHIAIHVFGRLLYQRYGLDSLKYCDNSIIYGCYHGIFDEVISKEGMVAIPSLFKGCKAIFADKSLSCEHGIGHGIAELLGPKRLVEALSLCKNNGSFVIPFGCVGGVFMEYNFPALYSIDRGVKPVRLLDTQDPYYPCEDLPEEYQGSCFVRLVEWWEIVLNQDYQKMGQLCLGIKNQQYQKDCFMGIGATISITHNFDIDRILDYCRYMPGRLNIAYCRAGGRWMLATTGQEVNEDDICENLNTQEKNICLFTNLSNIKEQLIF